ncbi:MAG: hypothetical protein WDZ40_01940 [Candidatus Spechtbacterales bacterium]
MKTLKNVLVALLAVFLLVLLAFVLVKFKVPAPTPFISAEAVVHNAVDIPETTLEIIETFEDEYKVRVSIIQGGDYAAILYKDDYDKIEDWLHALEEALNLVPEETKNYLRYIEFHSNTESWYTAQAPTRGININLNPNLVHPFTFEYFSEDGYSENEMIYVWLHELGHLWDEEYSAEDMYRGQYPGMLKGVTRYGCIGYIEECRIWDMNFKENFAEAFALYVVMPDYLNDNFPETYGWLKENAFYSKEYNINFEPPTSVLARLTGEH